MGERTAGVGATANGIGMTGKKSLGGVTGVFQES